MKRNITLQVSHLSSNTTTRQSVIFKQKLNNPQTQATRGLERIDSIFAAMGYVAPEYINSGTPSNCEGGES